MSIKSHDSLSNIIATSRSDGCEAFSYDEEALIESLNILHEIEKISDVKILTKEAKMLRLIKNNPNKYLKYYLVNSGLSVRWFSIIVQNLVSGELATKTNCQNDVRGKKLS